MMGLQLHSADFLHEDGVTYCIKREALDQSPQDRLTNLISIASTDVPIVEMRRGGGLVDGQRAVLGMSLPS